MARGTIGDIMVGLHRAAVLGLALWLASGAAAAQAPADDREERARKHFAVGQYREAIDLYGTLYAETLHPTYLRNIGRCYQNLGEPDKAITAFREYLRKARQATPEDRRQVEGFIEEMEAARRRASRETPSSSPTPAFVAAAPADADRPQPSGAFYTRWWFWTGVVVVAGAVAGGVILANRPVGRSGTLGHVDWSE